MRLNSANIKCKVTTTVTRTASNQIPKTAQLASVCIVDNDGVAGGLHMVRLHITRMCHLVSQMHTNFGQYLTQKIQLLMQFFLNLLSLVYLVYFSKGEVIVGATTGARAIVIPGTSVLVTLHKTIENSNLVKRSLVKHQVHLQPLMC